MYIYIYKYIDISDVNMPIYVCIYIYIYIEIRDSHLPDRKKTCPLCGTPPYLDSFVFGRPSRHQKKK